MFTVIQAEFLAPEVKRFVIAAPWIARARLPGQFVIVRTHDRGERIPLTIAASDPVAGTITIIVQGIGKTTKHLNTFEAGDQIQDVVGPLGKPSEIENFGRVVVIGGGVGAAIAYPTAVAMKQAGNHVVTILGARTRGLLLLEKEFAATSDEFFVLTDDGSYGEKGFVTHKLQTMLGAGDKIDLVLAIGPIPMMRAVAEVTRPCGVKTIVSLNPIMVDGTGMCGGCRVSVGGKSQFACVDGPEFDAHQVDFEMLIRRNTAYRDAERKSLQTFEEQQRQFVAKPSNHSCASEPGHQCRLAQAQPRAEI